MTTPQKNAAFVLIEWEKENILKEFDSSVQEVPDVIQRLDIKHLMLSFQNLDYYLPQWAQENATKEWLPKLKESGLKQLSILVPNKAIGQMAIRNIFLKNDQKEFPISFCNTFEHKK